MGYPDLVRKDVKGRAQTKGQTFVPTVYGWQDYNSAFARRVRPSSLCPSLPSPYTQSEGQAKPTEALSPQLTTTTRGT